MMDLIRSELRRFRWLALVAAVANLLLLVFLNRVSDLLQMTFLDQLPLLFIYMAAGLALAIAQVGSYRKPSQWAWLIHRPLAPSRIFAALALSALLLLAFVILLPLLALVIGSDLLTSRVVDLRHYLLPLHVLAFSAMAWLAGAHACVSRSRVAVAVFFAPLLLSLHLISTITLLLPVALGVAWLAFITLRSFRANREAPIRDNTTLLATALPMQVGLFLLCVVLWRFLFVTGGILLGTDPLNTDFPPRGGLIATERAEPFEVFQLGLENSSDARATSWREQMPLLEPLAMGPYLKRFPVRQQLSNLPMPNGWYDKERNIAWTFSHDRMLFVGRNPESGAARGIFGLRDPAHGAAGATSPFDAVPVVGESGDLLTPGALYGLDVDAQTLELRHALHAGEVFTEFPQRAYGRMFLLTSRRLIVFREDQRAAASIKPLLADWEIDLPGGPQQLEIASVVELMDGWLVSFVYGNGMRQIGFNQFNTAMQPWQQVLFVDADGVATVVGERDIDPDFPAVHLSDWWLSPPLDVLTTLPEATLDKGLTWPMLLTPLPRASTLHAFAFGMLLASLGAGWWWMRNTRIPASRRRFWLASCALLGLPALLSLLLMEPRELRE